LIGFNKNVRSIITSTAFRLQPSPDPSESLMSNSARQVPLYCCSPEEIRVY
jgi:hypothetical protein